jgi:hypothetical protein
MSNEHDNAGLFSLLPPAEREDIYWRLVAAFDELYASLRDAWDDAESLECELSLIFRGGECDM